MKDQRVSGTEFINYTPGHSCMSTIHDGCKVIALNPDVGMLGIDTTRNNEWVFGLSKTFVHKHSDGLINRYLELLTYVVDALNNGRLSADAALPHIQEIFY